jgi:hypothetical protein
MPDAVVLKTWLADQYLATYDPEARDGRGDATWTTDRAKARRFADLRAAMECWRQVPKARPVRPDGKPNRPLTAFTVTFETVTDG